MTGVLRLRPLVERDVPDLVRACADPEIARWTMLPQPFRRDDAAWLVAHAAEQAAIGGALHLAVVREGERTLRGCVAVVRRADVPHVGELGYWTAPWARRRGVARAGVELVAALAVRELGTRRLEAYVEPGNAPSRALLRALAFREEGLLAGARVVAGELRDMLLFARMQEAPAA